MQTNRYRPVALWLLTCCALLAAIVVVGGITRLTHSGLSIAEWQPLAGALPPLNDLEWQAIFDRYRETPEYRQVNHGMGMEEFKGIFWWEYGHRLLGRLIGLAYLLPFLYFALHKKIDGPLVWRLGVIFLLGGLQGAMGWFMVKSGLVDDPRVSHLRLTAHLGLALIIYAAMLWQALVLLAPRRMAPANAGQFGLWRLAIAVTALVFLMALSGGLVAGTRAGLAYNTFPLMNGHWLPSEILMLEPWYLNFVNNLATVQFQHRLGAWLLAALVPYFWWRSTRITLDAPTRRWCHVLLILLALQFGLGIVTLLLAVPVALGVAHQGGALLLFTAALTITQRLTNHYDSSRAAVAQTT